jgi:molecular chaperone GrpE (heat shock protein)
LRCIYVAYGDVSKVQLKASAKPLDALLQTGFDLYVETSPKQWMRAIDLPSNHPANVNLKAEACLVGLTDTNGQAFTILNAYNPEHKRLAAQEGLYIDVPYTQQKHEQLEQNIQKVLDELEEAVQFKELKMLADNIEKRLKRLQKTEKNKEKQPMWDGVVNDTLSLADALEKAVELTPDTGYERLAFRQAVEKAKKEAVLETATEESILLNPELLKGLRQRLLED